MQKMADFTHFDAKGKPKMVDVGEKPVSARTAIAQGVVFLASETLALIKSGGAPKGDVLNVARLAGIMGAKRTADLIPLCHPLALDSVEVDLITIDQPPSIEITAKCKVTARTGIEMEALTAVSIAALTVYDMCKAVDRRMRIGEIRLIEKTGGRSGPFKANDASTE
jgi:cyclic pyranopterin phosphate synthase